MCVPPLHSKLKSQSLSVLHTPSSICNGKLSYRTVRPPTELLAEHSSGGEAKGKYEMLLNNKKMYSLPPHLVSLQLQKTVQHKKNLISCRPNECIVSLCVVFSWLLLSMWQVLQEQSQGFLQHLAVEPSQNFAAPIINFHHLQLFKEIADLKTNQQKFKKTVFQLISEGNDEGIFFKSLDQKALNPLYF